MVGCLEYLSTVRIASWNCFGAAQTARAFLLREGAPDPHRFRHPSVAAELDAADVVCLQELWVRDAEALFDRVAHGHKTKDHNRTEWWPFTIGGSGLGVASRHPIVHDKIAAFSRPHSGAERFARKGMLHARIAAFGVEIDVVTTHLQSGTAVSSRGVRARHAAELAALVREVGSDERAFLLCGDFNIDGRTSERGNEYATLLGNLGGFRDLGAEADWPTYHPHPDHNLLAHRFDRMAPAQRLDYVFFRPPVRGAVEVTEFSRRLDASLSPFGGGAATHPSDHFALAVTLRVG